MTAGPFRAVVFDLDGTLLDTLDDLADAMNAVLVEAGFPPHPRDAYRYFVGEGMAMLVRRALPAAARGEAQVEAGLARMRAEYGRRWADRSKPYAGIPRLLDRLVALGLPLAVLSNKPDDFTQLTVARLLPAWPFAAVRGQRADTPAKPDPAGAFAVAAELRVAPADVLYVGDTATDMRTAAAAGMFPLGVTWGFRDRAELEGSGARHIVDRPAEVLALPRMRRLRRDASARRGGTAMKEYFKGIGKIQYEGPDSKNPLAFKHYDPEAKVGKRTMAQHLRFSVVYWHTMKGGGTDPFGPAPVYDRPWDAAADPMARAEDTMRAAFEFIAKLGAPFWAFHDRDIAPEGDSLKDSNARLDRVVKLAQALQRQTGVKLLWGTSNCFSNARFTHGAGTNPDPHVFAWAGAQIKKAMECTLELGGANYVFWGGREGYSNLLNTDLKQEQEQMARLLQMAVDHKKAIGFKGVLLIEPKPKEPTKHQYDYDAATVLGFLRAHGLLDEFAINIEANHATLAGHSFEHDLAVASAAGKLGSIDANRGDPLLGWDTDQFPTDLYSATYAMLVILGQGGLKPGGVNFDAKVRRGSFDVEDLFHAHIGGMDAFARGLKVAQRIRDDGGVADFVAQRYAGWRKGIGAQILKGTATLADMEAYVHRHGEAPRRSGREEWLENVINSYL